MNYPALDRAINAAYPPGSTFKPVTAIAAMQEHILQPYEPLVLHGAVREERTGLQELGSVRQRGDDAARRRSRAPATPTSTKWATASTGCRHASARGCRLGRAASASDRRPASISAPSAPGCCRRRRGGRRPTRRRPIPGTGRSTASGSRATRSSWRSARRTCSPRRCRWRGSTPRSQTAASSSRRTCSSTSSSPRRTGDLDACCRSPRPPAPEQTGVDAQALEVVRQGLFEATHAALGTSSAIFSGFPIPISGKTGTAEK